MNSELCVFKYVSFDYLDYILRMTHGAYKRTIQMFAALEGIKSFPDFDDDAIFGRSINVHKRSIIFFLSFN